MNSARFFLAMLLSVGCVALGDGCSSCQAPYDYSGPTLDANGKPVGGFNTRVGSVWAGTEPNPSRPKAPTIVPPGTPPAEPGTPEIPGAAPAGETPVPSTAETGGEPEPPETRTAQTPPSQVNAVKFVSPDGEPYDSAPTNPASAAP